MRVLILGAGFRWTGAGPGPGTTRSGRTSRVTLVDKADGFVFGFSKLDVMFRAGDRRPRRAPLRGRRAVGRPVFVQTTVRSIDPPRVVPRPTPDRWTPTCSSSRSAPTSIQGHPGPRRARHEFCTVAGAFALREVLTPSRAETSSSP